jgi:hypothetical protein
VQYPEQSEPFHKTPSTKTIQTQINETRIQELAKGHYSGWLIGDFIHSAGLDFFEGNIIKYVCRHRKKNGRQDLMKARDYIDKLLQLNYP